MRSLILCSSALSLFLFAPPAAAALAVTTGDTDSGEPINYVVIVEPLNGAVLQGTPDAVVPVVIEFGEWALGEDVFLSVDDVPSQNCIDQASPCTLEVTLAPGLHTLFAKVDGDEHTISVTVEDGGTATTGPTGDTPGPTGDTTDGTGDTTDPTGDTTDATAVSSSTGDASSDSDSDGASGGEKGCACSTGSTSTPDLLALAFAALLAPWRRRRSR